MSAATHSVCGYPVTVTYTKIKCRLPITLLFTVEKGTQSPPPRNKMMNHAQKLQSKLRLAKTANASLYKKLKRKTYSDEETLMKEVGTPSCNRSPPCPSHHSNCSSLNSKNCCTHLKVHCFHRHPKRIEKVEPFSSSVCVPNSKTRRKSCADDAIL